LDLDDNDILEVEKEGQKLKNLVEGDSKNMSKKLSKKKSYGFSSNSQIPDNDLILEEDVS